MAAKDFELVLRVQADLQQAVSQLRVLNDQMRVTKTAATEAGTGLSIIGTSAKASEAGIRSLDTQLTGIRAHMGRINAAAHDLRNAFVFAFAAHEVIDFTKSLVDANVGAQRIQNTMEQAFGKDGAAAQLQFVHDLSQKLGLDFKTAAEGFAQLGASAQGTGIQTSDLRKLFTGLSSAATVLHSSTEDVNGVMVQLAQAMSLGKLQMQDIRAISQHLPGTMTALSEAAKRMGTTLTAALKSGGLEAKQFIGVLGDVLQERFGEQAKAASHSLNSELNRLHSTLFELQTDGTGFADTFAGAIRDLNTTLSDPAILQGLKNLIAGFGALASKVIGATSYIGQFVGGLQQLGQYAAAQHSGGIVNDVGLDALETRLKADQAELADRGSNPNSLNEKSGRLRRAVFTWSDSQTRAALKDTKDLVSEVVDITGKIAAYKFAPKAPAPNPQTGDERGLFVGENPAAPGKPDKAALRKAAELAKQAAAAQNALTQSLISLQGQLDPTAAIYAKYNAAVKKATDEAELAKKAHGANAQAIDTQRDAVVALAGKIRDAALDQLAEKDRAAWEALRRSFETPAEVRVEDALKQIAKLNDMLKEGIITAQQYHGAIAQIGQRSVTGALPTYQGVAGSVGGPFGELRKNFQAEKALTTAYEAQKLALQQKFDDQDEAQHAAHFAALAKLDQDYKTKSANIEQSRQQLQLTAASNLFGQLAALSSSHNKKIAAIGKAAAIAQTIVKTYQSATEAYASLAGIPYIGPALGAAAAAAAIAAGLANVAQIRSQGTGGYAEGGYTGPGGKYQVAGVVHAGEGVLSQRDVAALGGPAGFKALRSSLHGFADGGFVHPLANVPSPAQMGFESPRSLPFAGIARSAANDAKSGASSNQPETHIHVWSVEEAAKKIAEVPSFRKAIVHIVSDNPKAIKARWGS